ncbi:hypothetical protein NC651_024039 [Populus alba x Populus x berolinensis]|nr:hypothetical protein NC651_024039 [Populus alba x Populus x berolinensis]
MVTIHTKSMHIWTSALAAALLYLMLSILHLIMCHQSLSVFSLPT